MRLHVTNLLLQGNYSMHFVWVLTRLGFIECNMFQVVLEDTEPFH